MNGLLFIYTFLLVASVLCAILLIGYSYKRRSIPGTNYFILVLFAAMIYNGAYIGEINSSNFLSAKFWFEVEHIAIPIQHYFWFMMSLEYVRVRKDHFHRAKYIMLYHPILYYFIYYTNDIHHQYIAFYQFVSNGHFPVIITEKGALYICMVISGTFLGVMSTIIYIRGYMRASRLQRGGYVIMIISSFFPWLSVYLNTTNMNYLGIDYFPVSTIISGFLYMLGIFRFEIFQTIPVATEMIFRQSKEGIMLVDSADCIIDVNNTFLEYYPELVKLTKKHTVASFIKRHPEFEGASKGKDTFSFVSSYGNRETYYSVKITKVLLDDDRQIGKIFTMSDITLFVENEKRLESMALIAMDKAETNEISFLQAQISPHFINNTLSVITSMITRAPNEAKELIINLSEYLANCYYFDSETSMVAVEQEIEIVYTYVNIEKARFQERLHFHLVCDQIPTIRIPRLILQPIVENAIRHGILKKTEGGNVWLEIRNDDRYVLFEVNDDGIGIEQERINVIMKESSNKRSIGIVNIHKRLIKHYQEGLKIQSKVKEGTTVSFRVPYQIKG